MSEPLFIFTHIPKAAGTTLTKILRREFRRSETFDVTPIRLQEEPACMAQLPPAVRLIVGHARYGLHRHTARPCRYFTLLREPVERVVSAFHYILRTPEHHLHTRFHAEKTELSAYARMQYDLQTKYISGCAACETSPISHEELALAKENLARHFEVFGLVERFNESLLLMVKAFGWSRQAYLKRNVNRHRAQPDSSPSEATLEAIREANQHDLQLYDFAASQLEERLAAQPPTFREELREFETRLRWHARRHALTSTVRSLLARLGYIARRA